MFAFPFDFFMNLLMSIRRQIFWKCTLQCGFDIFTGLPKKTLITSLALTIFFLGIIYQLISEIFLQYLLIRFCRTADKTNNMFFVHSFSLFSSFHYKSSALLILIKWLLNNSCLKHNSTQYSTQQYKIILYSITKRI